MLAQSIEEGLNSHVGKPTTTFEHGLFRVLEGFIDMAQREHELGEVGGRDVPLGGHPVELIQRGSGLLRPFLERRTTSKLLSHDRTASLG